MSSVKIMLEGTRQLLLGESVWAGDLAPEEEREHAGGETRDGGRCPSASPHPHRKLPLPSASGSRGGRASKWLRISLFIGVSASLRAGEGPLPRTVPSVALACGHVCAGTCSLRAAECRDPRDSARVENDLGE